MKVNKGYLPELKFKDLFFHVLYRWRSILLAALIAALVLGGLQFLSARKAEANAVPAEDPVLTGSVKYREEILEGQRAYFEQSPYIRLDAGAVWSAEKVWLVRPADDSVSADNILPAYGAPLAGVPEDELEEVFGTAAYAGELVQVTVSGESDTVAVRVLASDRETAERGMDFVTAKIEAIREGTASAIGSHELMLISENVAVGPDDELAEKQEILIENMTDNENVVRDGRAALVWPAQPEAAVRSAVKKAILAFVLVFILMCGLYVVLYAVNGRVKSGEELSGRYGAAVLGEMFRSGARKPGKGIDGWLEKLEGRNRVPADSAVCDRVASLAESWEGAGKIAVVSTLGEAEVKTLQEALAGRLPEKEISVIADFAENGKAVSEAAAADVVLLAEAKNVSRRNDMQCMAEALIAAKINVVGAVMV